MEVVAQMYAEEHKDTQRKKSVSICDICGEKQDKSKKMKDKSRKTEDRSLKIKIVTQRCTEGGKTSCNFVKNIVSLCEPILNPSKFV
jgi:hypothetical protein